MWLAAQDGVLASFVLADVERAQTSALLARLGALGVRCHLVSGDNAAAVRWWAEHFGIGHAASTFLVNGLARATGGAAEFVAPGERIEEKVLRTFGRLASPPVTGVEIDGYRVLRAKGNSVPNGIAAFLLEVQKMTSRRPHAYFNWVEGNPAQFLLKFLLSGQGDIAPVTREILRKVEPDPLRRPVIHAA